MNIFVDMKILWKFFGDITKLDYTLLLYLCIIGDFLTVKVQNGAIFLGMLKFQILFCSA